MLARNYRFTAYNSCGQTIATSGIVINARRWKFGTTGAVTYEASETNLLTSGSALANGSYLSSSSVDNSSNAYIGGDFELSFTAPTSASGDLTIYYETSTDGGTTYPTNGKGFVACVITVAASGTYVKNFRLS